MNLHIQGKQIIPCERKKRRKEERRHESIPVNTLVNLQYTKDKDLKSSQRRKNK